MSLETASFIHQLNPSNPSGADRLKEGDDHIRLLKAVLKATFPGITGPLDASVTQDFLKGLAGQLVPRGAITLFAGDKAPAGWWLCDGSEATLSDGSGKITTPDLRGRVPVGANADHALGTLFGQTSKTFTSEAGGGAKATGTAASAGAHTHPFTTNGHALTVAELPAHSHYVFAEANDGYATLNQHKEGAPNADASGGSQGASYDIGGGGRVANEGRTSSTGEGASHTHTGNSESAGVHTHTVTVDVAAHAHAVTVDTTQPSIAVNFIIKV